MNAPTHCSDKFTYDPTFRVLVAEASDLGRPMAARVFEDACDIGFKLRSSRTGKVINCYLSHEEYAEGMEVAAWIFKPEYGTPEYKEFYISVLND